MWTDNGRLYDRYLGNDGKWHKASVVLAKDTPQARRSAEKALKDKIEGILSAKEEKRLNELISEYLAHKDIKPSSLRNYRAGFNKIIELLDDATVSELSAPFIKRKIIESGKDTVTTNRYILLLNTLFKWAHEYGYINAPVKISPEKAKKKIREASELYLEADELKELLDEMQGTHYGYICSFMALTGCRIGEAVALTLDDIGEKHITITKTYDPNNKVINTPKTATSERKIYIQSELRAMLKEYLEWRRINMMAHGIRTNLLFYSYNGGYFSAETLRIRLHEIDPKLHPHIFRHTHVALLAEQGLPLDTISRRLGHADSQITKDVYFHVTKKIQENDEELIERVSFL